MDTIQIRKGTIADLPAIQRLCELLSEQSHNFDSELNIYWAHSPEGVAYYTERLAEKKGVCFVAEKAGEVVGFISTTIHEPGDWHLVKIVESDNLFVSETERGSGLGKRLVDTVKEWAKERGAKRIILTAFCKNTRALSFYEREGFTPYEITLELPID